MSNPSNFPGDGYFQGKVYAENIELHGGDQIQAKYLDGNHPIPLYRKNGTVATVTNYPAWIARAAGTIKQICAATRVVAVDDATLVIDVKKNGTSVLSTTLTLDSGNVAYTPENASLDGTKTTLAAGDMITVDATAAAGSGTLPVDLVVMLSVDQDYPH
jgi:hypothetical protein